MKSLKSPIFKESTDYISQNLQALSNEIPCHLLDYWIVENNNLGETEDNPEFGVFMYALLKYKRAKGINEFELPTDELMELFRSWQILLSAIEVNSKTEIVITPFQLFDFDNLSSFEITILRN